MSIIVDQSLTMSPPDASADASGSSSDDEDAYVPYASRPEWSDVTPLAQPEPARPVVAIDYRPEYVDAHDYFRAILKSGEVSRRALDLTAECLRMNGANYTVWHRRWALVEALAAAEAERWASSETRGEEGDRDEEPNLFDLEFAYASAMALENPKNYQVWNHMRLVSQVLGKASIERNEKATKEALDLDAKNIHAWTHRAWVAKTFGRKEQERTFAETMIARDVRNNSAWNQRFVVTFSLNDEETNEETMTSDSDETGKRQSASLIKRVDAELAFAARKISLAPDNESAWNYLRGVARVKTNEMNDVTVAKRVEEIARAHCSATLSQINALSGTNEEDVVPMDANDAEDDARRTDGDDDGPPSRNTRGASSAKETKAKTSSDCDSRHAISLLADVLCSSGAREEAAALYERLVHRDPIRANYWTHMRDETRRRRG